MSQDFKCFLGLHRYEVIDEKQVINPYNAKIGTSIVSRCTNCGKIHETVIYTDSSYRR